MPVNETNYPSNSDRAQQAPALPAGRPSEKHIEQVTTGGVKRKEKGVMDDIREFFGLGELKTFRDYVSFVSDITNRIYGALDTLMGNRRGNSNVPGARIAYSQPYQPNQPQGNARQRTAASYSYDDLIFDMRGDAEVTLSRMYELLGTYRAVSIADMFDLAGVTSPNGYTDNKYGWTDLSEARVVRVNGGYIIDLPRAIQL